MLYTWYSLIYTCGREAKHIDMRLQLEHCRRETWARELNTGVLPPLEAYSNFVIHKFLEILFESLITNAPIDPWLCGMSE